MNKESTKKIGLWNIVGLGVGGAVGSGGPAAVSCQQWRQQHSFHAVITALDDKDARHSQIIPVGQ